MLFRSPPVVPVLYDKIDTHYIPEQQQDEHRHEAGYPNRIVRVPDHHDANQYCQTRLLIKHWAGPTAITCGDHTFVGGAQQNYWLRPHLCRRGLFGCCSNGQCLKFTSHKGLHCLICGLWACVTSCIMVRILYTSV